MFCVMASPEPCISGRPMKVVLSFRTETRARPFFTKKRRLLRRLKRRIRASWGRFYRFGLVSGAKKGQLREWGAWRRLWDDWTVLRTPWGRVRARSPPGPRTGDLCAPGDALGLLGCRSRSWPWSEGVSIEQLKSRNIKKRTGMYAFKFILNYICLIKYFKTFIFAIFLWKHFKY